MVLGCRDYLEVSKKARSLGTVRGFTRQVNYLFPNKNGSHIDLANLRNRVWYPTLDNADLRRRVMYQTRHTFASNMIQRGEDITWVARMMGDNVETVLRHYNRYIPRDDRRDGAQFLKAYGSAGN